MPQQQIIIQTTGKPRMVRRQSGRAGSLQTLKLMAELVRHRAGNLVTNEAAKYTQGYAVDLGLRDFAAELADTAPGHSDERVTDALFFYTRDKIKYRRDPWGFEKITDARRVLELGFGDCGDKVVLLATMLALLGIKSRFAVLSFRPPQFQHVFLEVWLKNKWVSYDPTPEEAIPGWSAKGLERAYYPIFEKGDTSDPANLAGFLDVLKKVAVVGSSFIPGAGPFVSAGLGMAFGAQEQAAGSKKQKEQARDAQKEEAYKILDGLLGQVNAGTIDPDAAIKQSEETVAAYLAWADKALGGSVGQSAHNFVGIPGGFNDRKARVRTAAEEAKARAAAAAAAAAAAEAARSNPGAALLSGNLSGIPKEYLIGGAALFAIVLLTR